MNWIYSSLFLFAMVSAVTMISEWERESHEFEDKTEFCSAEKKPTDTLQSVFIVQRHSATGSTYVLPKTPIDSNCKVVSNQVTPAGVTQTYNIVQFLKDRYRSFLPTNPNEAYFRSTNLDRTLYSISLKIRGLFGYKKDPAFVPAIFFNPPRILDALYYGVYCPVADQEINYNNLLTADAAKFNQTNTKLFDYLSRKTGLSADINILEAVFDYISALKFNGCKLPEFYSDKLLAAVTTQFAALNNLWFSSDLAKTLRGGPLAQELIKRIDYFIRASLETPCDQPQSPKRKLHIIETHNYNIAALLAVLGQPLTSPVRTGATLILELHNINGHEYIQVYYLDETESTPFGPLKTITLAGSTKSFGIKLNNFKSLVAPYIPTDFDKQCDIPCTFDYHQGYEDYGSETDDTVGNLARIYS